MMMSQQKISRGIIAFGLSLAVLSAAAAVFWFDFRHCVSCQKNFSPALVIASLVYAAVSALAGVVTGIGLLKRRESMRKAAIALTCVNLAVGIPACLLSRGDLASYVQGQVEYAAALTGRMMDPGRITGLFIFSFAMVVCYAVALIFFLTRPQVRERFK